MSRIDDTRDNIRTRKMSEDERKAMFKKFVDHGGEVISERPKKYRQFDREKQRQYREKVESHRLQSQKRGAVKRQTSGGQRSEDRSMKKQYSLNPVARYFHLIRIRFNLFIRGVTDASGRNIKDGFLHKFNTEYKTAVMHLQSVYIELFRNIDYTKAQQIIDRLDALKPLYFELIEMGADIYDRDVTGMIIDEFIIFEQQTFKTTDLANPLIEYFKRIYLLYSYQTTLMASYEKAFALYDRYGMKKIDTADMRRRTRNSIYIVFNKLYPRLYWIFCFINRRVISPFDFSLIDAILGVTPEMKPGTRVANSQSRLNADFALKTREQREMEERQRLDEAHETIKKKSAPKLSDEVKRGLELMSQIPYDEYAAKFLKNARFTADWRSNPMIKAYLVFQEFDEEYSIIFTTNKIKIAVPHDRRNEIDYRIKLSEFYNRIRHIDEEFKSYFNQLELYDEVQNDKPVSQSQYLSHTKRITEMEKSISSAESSLRARMRQFFLSVIDALEVLARDMEKKQKIVLNPQELIEFDYELEGNKKLKGKKIYQAILQVVDYASAFVHRLSHNNDLSPGDASSRQQTGSVEEPAAAVLESTDAEGDKDDPFDKTGEQEKMDTGSILDELDNLL
ncbi:MAG: hypothetical protein ACOC2H_02070 [Spirochaetota bacterium]